MIYGTRSSALTTNGSRTADSAGCMTQVSTEALYTQALAAALLAVAAAALAAAACLLREKTPGGRSRRAEYPGPA